MIAFDVGVEIGRLIALTQISGRLAINRTVKRLLDVDEPPRYRREPAGSMLDRSSR